ELFSWFSYGSGRPQIRTVVRDARLHALDARLCDLARVSPRARAGRARAEPVRGPARAQRPRGAVAAGARPAVAHLAEPDGRDRRRARVPEAARAPAAPERPPRQEPPPDEPGSRAARPGGPARCPARAADHRAAHRRRAGAAPRPARAGRSVARPGPGSARRPPRGLAEEPPTVLAVARQRLRVGLREAGERLEDALAGPDAPAAGGAASDEREGPEQALDGHARLVLAEHEFPRDPA